MQIIPSFLVDKASCTRQFESELSLHSLASFFPIKEGIFLPLRLSCKESSTFLTKPLFNSLYDPFGSPCRGQKPQEREDVAGYAIASARVLVSSAKPVPLRAADESLRNRVAIVCRLAHHQDSINLPLSRKRFLKPCITVSAHS